MGNNLYQLSSRTKCCGRYRQFQGMYMRRDVDCGCELPFHSPSSLPVGAIFRPDRLDYQQRSLCGLATGIPWHTFFVFVLIFSWMSLRLQEAGSPSFDLSGFFVLFAEAYEIHARHL